MTTIFTILKDKSASDTSLDDILKNPPGPSKDELINTVNSVFTSSVTDLNLSLVSKFFSFVVSSPLEDVKRYFRTYLVDHHKTTIPFLVDVNKKWIDYFGAHLNDIPVNQLDQIIKYLARLLKSTHKKLKEHKSTTENDDKFYESTNDYLKLLNKAASGAKSINKDTKELLISVLISYIDLPQQQMARVIMVIAILLKDDQETSGQIITSEIENLIIEGSDDSLIIAFIFLTRLWSLSSHLATSIFNQNFMLNLSLERTVYSFKLTVSALEFISSSCGETACRNVIISKYFKLLLFGLDNGSDLIRSLTCLILIKLWKEINTETQEVTLPITIKEICEFLIDFIRERKDIHTIEQIGTSDSSSDIVKYSVEGLAYASLQIQIRQLLRKDSKLFDILITFLKKKDDTVLLYGVLTTLSNVSRYNPIVSEEAESMQSLKNYSDLKKRNDKQVMKDNDKDVETFNRKLLVHSQIIKIVSDKLGSLSNSCKSQSLQLVTSLSTDKTLRAELVKQGALWVILSIIRSKTIDDEFRRIGIRGLAKILISVDPSLAMVAKVSPSDAIEPLIIQLDVSNNTHTTVPLLDAFEALLALTNLASIDQTCREHIVRSGFVFIEPLMLSPNELVQRGSIELVCNLMLSPECVAKYLDNSNAAKSRLEVLTLLTDLEDYNAARAALGAIAILSEYDLSGDILAKHKKLLKVLVRLITEGEEDELIARAGVILVNVITYATKTLNVVEELNELGLKQGLQGIVGEFLKEDDEVKDIIQELSSLVIDNV